MNHGDEPVFVPADVKDSEATNLIGGTESRPQVGKRIPFGFLTVRNHLRNARSESVRTFQNSRSGLFEITCMHDDLRNLRSRQGISYEECSLVKELRVDFPKKLKAGLAAINTSAEPFKVEFGELKVSGKYRSAGNTTISVNIPRWLVVAKNGRPPCVA